MSYIEVPSWTWRPATAGVLERLGGLGIVGALGVSVLVVAPGGPEWLGGPHVTMAVLLLAGVGLFGRFLWGVRRGFASDAERYRSSLQVVLFALLFGVVLQSRTPGYGIEASRHVSAAIVFLVLMAFCVSARDPRQYSPLQWLAIACLATVLGIFFHHSLSVPEISVRSRHPVWSGVIMAVGLVVVPQYLSRRAFLWAVNRYAAALVLLTLPVYVVGEYTLFGLSFTFHDAYTVPLVGHEVPAVRSVFVHRNAFAVVAFAGFVTAVGEFHRALDREHSAWPAVVPAALLATNSLGLAVSYGRALWVITPMAVGVYLAYLAFGRRAVPLAVLAAFAYLVGGIAAVQSGRIPLPEGTPTRVLRWYPAVAAILDNPSVLGAGLVDPGRYIEPYQGNAYSPHNSYLTMAIRAGILGGLAYLVLIASSLLSGIREARGTEVNAAVVISVLTLAVGFTAHQQFEAYTLFNVGSSTVLAVLVFGFLLFGERERPSNEARF